MRVSGVVRMKRSGRIAGCVTRIVVVVVVVEEVVAVVLVRQGRLGGGSMRVHRTGGGRWCLF